MSRPEGSVVFMTTNDAACLDKAVTRSGRVDRVLRLGHAEPGQSRRMVDYFFPGQDCEQFLRDVAGHTYTTADLHQYLFRCDKPDAKQFIKSQKRDLSSTAASRDMYT